MTTPETKKTPRPVHLIFRWTGIPADESPICGAAGPIADRTADRRWLAAQPDACPACLATSSASEPYLRARK